MGHLKSGDPVIAYQRYTADLHVLDGCRGIVEDVNQATGLVVG